MFVGELHLVHLLFVVRSRRVFLTQCGHFSGHRCSLSQSFLNFEGWNGERVILKYRLLQFFCRISEVFQSRLLSISARLFKLVDTLLVARSSRSVSEELPDINSIFLSDRVDCAIIFRVEHARANRESMPSISLEIVGHSLRSVSVPHFDYLIISRRDHKLTVLAQIYRRDTFSVD
jgi:hypothetical protein